MKRLALAILLLPTIAFAQSAPQPDMSPAQILIIVGQVGDGMNDGLLKLKGQIARDQDEKVSLATKIGALSQDGEKLRKQVIDLTAERDALKADAARATAHPPTPPAPLLPEAKAAAAKEPAPVSALSTEH